MPDTVVGMSGPVPSIPPASRRAWGDWLGLNASTFALLGTIFLVTASTELWSPLMPEYLKALREHRAGGDVRFLLLIGAYQFYRDALEAINYYAGGAISGRFNTRRSLLLFNLLPLVGLIMLATWSSAIGVFIAIPFIFVWDSISGPATLTVVGDALPPDRRTMAFSLQAIFRRTSKIAAGVLSGLVIAGLGRRAGVRADAVIAVALVLAAIVLQLRLMKTASRDATVLIHRPRELLRRFSPDLRRLLAADALSRWAEGVAGPFIILYCVPRLSANADRGTAQYQSILLNIQYATNILMYLLIGPLASREGLAKKPYIGLTFVFFALFPISLAVFGPTMGWLGLALAFVVGGLRELGEPARKAMVSDLVPAEARTQSIGLYWSVRSLLVMWAGPVGAVTWILGDRVHDGWGAMVNFWTAGLFGLIGAIVFFVRFGRSANRSALT